MFQAPKIAEKIQAVIPPLAYVMTWMELNESLFSALKLETNIMFFTITLIVHVYVFCFALWTYTSPRTPINSTVRSRSGHFTFCCSDGRT